jgi:hypothetical protein
MSDETFPRNRAVVIGRLYRRRDERRGNGGRRRETNDLGGRLASYELQTMTPYGEPYALPLAIASGRVGQQIGQLQGGALVQVTGEVRLQRRVDVRFAERPTDPANRGLDVRECVLDVTGLARLSDEEPTDDGSAVWLEGVVAEPPYTTRHPSRPGLVYEATTLRITLLRPSPVPGSRAIVTEEVRVSVAVPADHPDAGLLRRAGNQVRIEGQLDCVMEVRRGREVDAVVGALDAEYAERAAGAGGDEAALLALRRTYRGRLRGLLDEARLRVVAATVEGLEGAEPLGRRVARAERAAFAQQRAGRRIAADAQRERREQRAAERDQSSQEEAASESAELEQRDTVVVEVPGEQAPTADDEPRPARRRRAVRERPLADDPALGAMVASALGAVGGEGAGEQVGERPGDLPAEVLPFDASEAS